MCTAEQHIAARLRHLEELEHLKTSRGHQSCELAVQTMPDLGNLAVQTESQLNVAMGISVATVERRLRLIRKTWEQESPT